jgi:hypothetical protein
MMMMMMKMNFITEIVPLMGKCGKYGTAKQATQDNTARKICDWHAGYIRQEYRCKFKTCNTL